MGRGTESGYDLGYLFTALPPEMFADEKTFQEDMERLGDTVRNCPAVQPGGKVYIPGEIFGATLATERERTELDLDEDVYARLSKMSVSLDGGYENNKAMN